MREWPPDAATAETILAALRAGKRGVRSTAGAAEEEEQQQQQQQQQTKKWRRPLPLLFDRGEDPMRSTEAGTGLFSGVQPGDLVGSSIRPEAFEATPFTCGMPLPVRATEMENALLSPVLLKSISARQST